MNLSIAVAYAFVVIIILLLPPKVNLPQLHTAFIYVSLQTRQLNCVSGLEKSPRGITDLLPDRVSCNSVNITQIEVGGDLSCLVSRLMPPNRCYAALVGVYVLLISSRVVYLFQFDFIWVHGAFEAI